MSTQVSCGVLLAVYLVGLVSGAFPFSSIRDRLAEVTNVKNEAVSGTLDNVDLGQSQIVKEHVQPHLDKFRGRGKLKRTDLNRIIRILKNTIAKDDDFIPHWVQMSFHDCFGRGGCNGCLNRNDPANIHLLEPIEETIALRAQIAPQLSLADFIALAGTVAATVAAESAGGSLNLPYSTGRQDCGTDGSDQDPLPAGFQTDTIEVLGTDFDLTPGQVVALMGGHSLGETRRESSGFDGPWDDEETQLDTGYYKNLANLDWRHEQVDNDRATSTQWSRNGFMMLHVDMILQKQFTTSGEFDTPSCTFDQCIDQPQTAAYVQAFQDLRTFHAAFSEAYLKMITKSDFPLTPV